MAKNLINLFEDDLIKNQSINKPWWESNNAETKELAWWEAKSIKSDEVAWWEPKIKEPTVEAWWHPKTKLDETAWWVPKIEEQSEKPWWEIYSPKICLNKNKETLNNKVFHELDSSLNKAINAKKTKSDFLINNHSSHYENLLHIAEEKINEHEDKLFKRSKADVEVKHVVFEVNSFDSFKKSLFSKLELHRLALENNNSREDIEEEFFNSSITYDEYVTYFRIQSEHSQLLKCLQVHKRLVLLFRRSCYISFLKNKRELFFKILKNLFRSFDDEGHIGYSPIPVNFLNNQYQFNYEKSKRFK